MPPVETVVTRVKTMRVDGHQGERLKRRPNPAKSRLLVANFKSKQAEDPEKVGIFNQRLHTTEDRPNAKMPGDELLSPGALRRPRCLPPIVGPARTPTSGPREQRTNSTAPSGRSAILGSPFVK